MCQASDVALCRGRGLLGALELKSQRLARPSILVSVLGVTVRVSLRTCGSGGPAAPHTLSHPWLPRPPMVHTVCDYCCVVERQLVLVM